MANVCYVLGSLVQACLIVRHLISKYVKFLRYFENDKFMSNFRDILKMTNLCQIFAIF